MARVLHPWKAWKLSIHRNAGGQRLDEAMEMGKLMGFLNYIVELVRFNGSEIRPEHPLRLVVEIPPGGDSQT